MRKAKSHRAICKDILAIIDLCEMDAKENMNFKTGRYRHGREILDDVLYDLKLLADSLPTAEQYLGTKQKK
jgi:hypothetical protein